MYIVQLRHNCYNSLSFLKRNSKLQFSVLIFSVKNHVPGDHESNMKYISSINQIDLRYVLIMNRKQNLERLDSLKLSHYLSVIDNLFL